MEKIIWTDHVRNEKVLHRDKERTNMYVKQEEGRPTGLVTYFIGIVLQKRYRMKHRRKDRTERERRGRRRRQLLLNLIERTLEI